MVFLPCWARLSSHVIRTSPGQMAPCRAQVGKVPWGSLSGAQLCYRYDPLLGGLFVSLSPRFRKQGTISSLIQVPRETASSGLAYGVDEAVLASRTSSFMPA